MSTLTITQTTNGYFNFTPENGKERGDYSPGANHFDGKITFTKRNGDVMFADVKPEDIIIVSAADVTSDDFDNVSDVFDKLKELEF